MTDTFKDLPLFLAGEIETVATSGDLPTSGVIEGSIRYVKDSKAVYTFDGSSWNLASGVSSGGSSTDHAVARWDGVSGALLQDSAVTIDDLGNISGAGTISSSEITSSSLTANRALVSGTSKEVQSSTVTSTELGNLSGTSSNIQTQLDAKLDDVGTANDNEIPRFDTNGQQLQSSGVSIDDSDNISGANDVTISGSIDKSSAASLDIGGTNATTINVGRSGQTTVVKGNLQVDGTTTTVNSTTLEVTDANITINNGGNQASADDTAGLTVEMSDAIDARIIYDKDVTSKFKVGEAGTEVEVADVSSSQSLINKTIDADSNTLSNIKNTDIKAGAAIDVTKLADGTVSNTELQYLNGVGSTLSGNTDIATLTNKTIDGNNNTISNLAHGVEVDQPSSGVHGVTGFIVGTTDTQTLSSKTFSDAITGAEIATPSTPATGYSKIYPKSDGKWYFLDDAGVEQELGSGVGAGEINYIDNGDAESNATTGWATYDDGASATPVDGTGGTSSNLTLTAQNTTVLRGTYSFKLAKGAADAQGEGVSYDFTIDKADQLKNLELKFDYNTDGTYAAGDLAVYVYDVDTSTLITPRVTEVTGYDKDNSGSIQFRTDFSAADVSSTNYRLIFHVTSTSASAYDFYFDNVVVGPGSVYSTAKIGEWTDYTATTQGFGTLGTSYFQYRIVGDSIQLRGDMTIGTPTAVEAQIGLPSGYTISNPSTNTIVAGRLLRNSSIAVCVQYSVLTTDGDTFINFGYMDSSATTYNPTSPINASGNFGTSERSTFVTDPIPIAELIGTGTVNLGANDVEYAASESATGWNDDGTAGETVYGQNGASITGALGATRTKVVQFQTDIQDSDEIRLQFKVNGTTDKWVDAENYPGGYVPHSTNAYGARISNTDTNTVTVTFYQYAAPGTTYDAATGANWGSGTWSAWRVVKHRSGIPVGFGSATSTDSGLVKLPTSEIRVQGGNTTQSHGGTSSGDTAIRNFQSSVVSTGSVITWTSATTTEGDKFTVSEDGIYAIHYSDVKSTGAAGIGISVNTTTTSTGIFSIASAERKGYNETPAANSPNMVSATLRLSAGDIVRAHTDGSLDNGNNGSTAFHITQLMRL